MSQPPFNPIHAQKAMVFIDGTNLFYRLDGAPFNLRVPFHQLITRFVGNRQIVRMYLYTVEQHLARAKQFHGDNITEGMRIVFGDGIPTKDGNIKEKGVDALLVADLVYHAAVKNLDYALVVSADTDFVHAIRRVEDFGCRTGILGVCDDVPPRLQAACDEVYVMHAHEMANNGWVTIRTK